MDRPCSYLSSRVFLIDESEPMPVNFLGIRIEILRRAQAQPRLGIDFWEGSRKLQLLYSKNRGSSRLGIEHLWRAWARAWLEINFQGSGLAWDGFFRALPITTFPNLLGTCIYYSRAGLMITAGVNSADIVLHSNPSLLVLATILASKI